MPNQNKPGNIDRDPRAAVRGMITKFSFIEARRVKGPIYDALVAELYEEGCTFSARKLSKLAEKETDMILKGVTRESVQDHKSLLFSLFENAKKAEKAALIPACGGVSESFQLMYQMLLMVDPYDEKFDWVIEDIYEIVANICEKYEAKGKHGSSELIARIYTKYGELLSKKTENIPKAIKYYERALKISRGESWGSTTTFSGFVHETNESLHMRATLKFVELLLKYGQILVRNDPISAAKMAQKAKICVAEIGVEENHLLYCKTCTSQGTFLMESGQFMEALAVFEKIQKELSKKLLMDYCKLKSQIFLNMGICLTNLNELDRAMAVLQKALYLNQVYGLKHREGMTQMNLGKLFSRRQELKMAKTAYEAAKEIFTELNDAEQNKTIVYLLAKLKADEIFPTFMDMVKSTSYQYCAFYNLRQWKNQCRPFWNSLFEEMEIQKKNPIYCLLEKKDTLDD